MIATAPACAVPMTVRTLAWLKTFSTATASGRVRSSQASMPSAMARSRSGTSTPAGVRTTPTSTRLARMPRAPSMTPSPHRVSPGSTPSTRIHPPDPAAQNLAAREHRDPKNIRSMVDRAAQPDIHDTPNRSLRDGRRPLSW
ncbi:exported hypothetical protein [Frankia canadensis]|uniref:Uncharacterized protein n=1 Tax=Frankia canadensis TaxID=1836972 RepID=A0A2I2KYL1_9ACTN|nr:exported hypothetical protein [Frankia canadensis]SOU58037.1 exported hypothetical protein [Frankia canadensis]